MYDESVMSKTLDEIIKAYCADFLRRAQVIADKSAPFNVIMEYKFLNYRIFSAASEYCGTGDALEFIKDIGEGRGYAKSELSVMSESVYKTKKREIKLNIARRLSLL